MSTVSLPLQRSFRQTSRRDRWWLQPVLTFIGLSAFVIYSTWAAFQGSDYSVAGTNYLSPFYSPLLWGDPHHAWFGASAPSWLPSWFSSPALFILWAPAGFRLTCYYYRGAYYKAFWMDPPNCAVGEPRKGYIGENGWPLKIQNIHRYFMYIAVAFIALLTYDAIKSFFFAGSFGIGIGTLILCANVVLLSGYTFGCHSLRHVIGGKKDCITESPLCHKLYKGCSALNRRHMLWAWMSLFMVGFADFYIRMVSMGVWRDFRII